MLDIILIAIGIFSVGIEIRENMKAYEDGTYNPYLFRLRKEYETNYKYILSVLGWLAALVYVQNTYYKSIFVVITLIMYGLSKTIFNYKFFRNKNNKNKNNMRIIFETIIWNIIIILVIFNF